jgi:hypothetical protein
MNPPLSATDILNREFLTIRGRLLEVAAALDRIDRAGGLANDARLDNLHRVLELLAQPGPDRAERMQHLLSLPYDPDWRRTSLLASDGTGEQRNKATGQT